MSLFEGLPDCTDPSCRGAERGPHQHLSMPDPCPHVTRIEFIRRSLHGQSTICALCAAASTGAAAVLRQHTTHITTNGTNIMTDINTTTSSVAEGTNLDTSASTVFEKLQAAALEPTCGDIPRRLLEELDEAFPVIDFYAPDGKPGSRVAALGRTMQDATTLGTDFAVRAGVTDDRGKQMVQEAWQDLGKVPATNLGRITVSLDEPDILDPQILFVCVPTATRTFLKGEREAMAIAYYPQSTYQVIDKRTGELIDKASNFDTDFYSHVMCYFSSAGEAKAALRDLRAALRVWETARTTSAYIDDPVRMAIQQELSASGRRPAVSVL